MNLSIRSFLHNQLVVAIALVACGWFLFEIKGILIIVFISYIIMAAFSPLVDYLKKKGIPATLAVLLPYILTVGFFTVLIFPLIPFFISQIQSLLISFPIYLNQATGLFSIQIDRSEINSLFTSELNTIGKSALEITKSAFGGLFSIFAIMVLSFYLLIDRDRIKYFISLLFPKGSHEKVFFTLSQIEEKLGGWIRGQIILSLVMGLIIMTALTLLGLEFALPLALLAGMLEIIPTLGPILAATPAVIVALNTSPTMAITIVVLYTVVQFLENHILVPRIMGKAVGLHPIIIILSIMIGGKLMGVPGALLSIPFISLLVVVYTNVKR